MNSGFVGLQLLWWHRYARQLVLNGVKSVKQNNGSLEMRKKEWAGEKMKNEVETELKGGGGGRREKDI